MSAQTVYFNMAYRRSVRRTYRRPAFRRRSYRKSYRGRRNVRRSKSSWASTNGARFSSTPYRGRRVSKTVWRKRQLRASDDAEHYRSVLTASGVNATSGLIGTALVAFEPFIPNLFYTVAGGLQNYTTDRDFSGDLFLRGGRTSITFSNPNPGTLRVRLWEVRTTTNGTLSGSLPLSAVSSAWDPTVVPDFQRFYKIMRPTEFLLRSAQVVSKNAYIAAYKLDTSMFAAEQQRSFWVYSFSPVDVPGAVNMIVEVTSSVSFTGDATVN